MKIAPRNSRLQNLLAFSARSELRLFVFQALLLQLVKQSWSKKIQSTLLIFGTKCEGKFVSDDRTIHVATEHVQCTGLGWWESWNTD